MEEVKRLIKGQRKDYFEAAAAGEPLTETRISASNFRKIKIIFTEPVEISEDDAGGRNLRTEHNFIVQAEKGEEDENEDLTAAPIIDHWELTKFEPESIEIDVHFTDPLKVSTDDKPDLLFVSLDLSSLRDANGKAFSSGIVKYIEIPT